MLTKLNDLLSRFPDVLKGIDESNENGYFEPSSEIGRQLHSQSVAPFVPRKRLPARAFPGAVTRLEAGGCAVRASPGRLGSLAEPQRRGTSP